MLPIPVIIMFTSGSAADILATYQFYANNHREIDDLGQGGEESRKLLACDRKTAKKRAL